MRTNNTHLSLAALLLTALAAFPAFSAGNSLAHHPSPYLALHGQDPTDWQAWSDDVIARASRENKLILVSVGYFSCHWCHVMQRESYQDATVAAALNKDFISVKVDRELRPALDQTLITFVEATRGQAGWPLNVFLTPEGYPLFGTTYLPRDDFLDIIEQLRDRWRKEGRELGKLAEDALPQWLPDSTADSIKAGEAHELEQALIAQALAAGDVVAGGFGNQNKFPSSPQLFALLDAHARNADKQVESFVGYTLFMMATQGLRDQIGGGFYRYTVDPSWQTPHFEKMLYNNAQLPSLYLRAAKVLGQPSLADVAVDTLDFAIREMKHPQGGFIASLSAVDDKDVEGGYYLWYPEDIRDLLDKDEYRIVERAWKLKEAPPFEDGYLPIQGEEVKVIADSLKMPLDEVIRLSQSARSKLFEARQERKLPVDEKRLAAWNALMLSALLDAVAHGQEQYRKEATELRNFLVSRLIKDGILKRSIDNASDSAGEDIGSAGLEDYAYTARALWDYGQAFDSASDRDTAVALVETAWRLFESAKGWQLGSNSLLPFDLAEPQIADGPMPSPSAVLIGLTLDMAGSGIAAETLGKAGKALYRGHQRLQDEPYFYASQIRELARHENKAKANE